MAHQVADCGPAPDSRAQHPTTKHRAQTIPVEDVLHETVAKALDVLLLPPVQWVTFPAGGYRLTPAERGRLYRLGLKPGWPDILIVWRGRIFGIEIKTTHGQLTQTRLVRSQLGTPRIVTGQVEMHAMLRAAGMLIAVCRSLDDVFDALRAWAIPTRLAIEDRHQSAAGNHAK